MRELNKNMYFKAKPATFETARALRKSMTISEQLLWEKLSKKQIQGLRFRRQHPIDIFIADFYCHEARLIIEIDGEIHEFNKEYDEGREAEIKEYGIKVIRFSNYMVNYEIEAVLRKINSVVASRIQYLRSIESKER